MPYEQRRWAIYDTVQSLQPTAQLSAIWVHTKDKYDKDLSIGWVWTTLKHFENEGYLRSERNPDAGRMNRNALYWFATSKARPDLPRQPTPNSLN